MPTAQELGDRFSYHPATDVTGPLHNSVRDAALALALRINELCPESREASLALTSVQDAMMWANAAIAIHTPRP